MPSVLKITAVSGADNVVTFAVVDLDGNPVDLDAAGATAVKVEVCGQLFNSIIDAESFAGNSVQVKFGLLDIPAGTGYKPKIYYISPAKPNGETLAADCFETSILLKMVC